MTYTFKLLLLTLAATAISSLPTVTIETEFDSPESTTQVGNIFHDLFTEFVAELRVASELSAEAAQHFTKRLQNVTQHLLQEAQNYGRQLGESIGSLKAFPLKLLRQLQNMQNASQEQVLRQVGQKLHEVLRQMEQLKQLVGQLRLQWQERIAENERRVVKSWRTWADKQLEAARFAIEHNKGALDKTARVTDAFISSFSHLLLSCGDEIEAQLDAFAQNVQHTNNIYQPVVSASKTLVRNCIQSAEGVVKEERLMDCDKDFRANLQHLQRAHCDLLQLHDEGETLLARSYERNSCVMQILSEFQREKNGVQNSALHREHLDDRDPEVENEQ